ncbi:hypothetical protein BD309DRAFT_961798 [Dichomitus squalens]|nr:hypothetical protein BD309DRAFT_961798 [Dichomitus squalens]
MLQETHSTDTETSISLSQGVQCQERDQSRLRTSTPGSLTSLPFDLIHILLDYTGSIDLVHLCSTCKELYTHLENPSVWIRLCASYGLRDFTRFGDISPRTIYSSLLYPYGGLLGLWAGDHPFTGSIMEYRLFPGDEHEQGGIVGEVWHFARSQTATDDDAVPPDYIRVLKISFGNLPADFPSSQADGPLTDDTPKVHVICDTNALPSEAPHPSQDVPPDTRKVGTPHLSSLGIIPSSRTVHHIEFYRRTVDLPEFPKPDAAWFDSSPSRLPRLRALPAEPDADQRSIIKIFPAMQLPRIWSSPTATVPRPAISIRCPYKHQCACFALRVPPLPFTALDPAHSQYYPMKRDIVPGVDPRSPGFTLDSLRGIWYGSYGIDGTEVLHVARAAPLISGMGATKLTGDIHVPRGAITWIVDDAGEESEDVRLAREFWAEMRGEQPARLYTGRGVLAARGFVRDERSGNHRGDYECR